ncbi:MAG: GIY-YIG nuclease family protein [Minisyncoccia bacterium]
MKKIPQNIPQKPGVYLFKNKKGGVLYVGRAVNLKNRIKNYFSKGLNPRIKEMVDLAQKIEFITTNNLLEAIILEANLIKKYWPKYNIRERDNRSFVYIAIPKKEFTHPIIIRGRELNKFPPEKAEVFGPYKSLSLITAALRILRRIFPYSTCKINSLKPCFDYQIGLCPGACLGKISKEDYQKNIDNLILFLKGEKKTLFKKLLKENPEKIQALKHIQDVALISKDEFLMENKFYRIEGYDISYFKGKGTYGSMVVFINGEKSPENYRLFKIKEAQPRNDLEALKEVILRRIKHSEWRLPDLIVIDGGKPQIDYLANFFQEAKINIPLVGISKYQNDKLVFPKKTKKAIKNLIEEQKETLLKSREEAHRFAIKFSRHALTLK